MTISSQMSSDYRQTQRISGSLPTMLGQSVNQSGFTLVEVMIAITLSLILIAGVIQIYVSSKESFRVQNELAQVQENQRIAVEFLQRDIRQAGFVPYGAPLITNKVVVNDGGGQTSDDIFVTYSSTTDCLGQATPNGIAVNHYTINNNRLMCEGNGNQGVPQPIADGVSNMQILLGKNTVFANDSLSMPSADEYINPAPPATMTNVVSIRIALLMRSADPVKTQTVAQSYNLLDTTIAPTDRVKRQVVITTIPIRNANNV